jgi:predicted TIM-barrel fold metal-dependent hydrolase
VRLACDYPDTTIVLNHAGLPSAGAAREWRAAMAELAACSNVAVKISGMGVPVREFVLGVLELFGVERAMLASNYPVDSLRASFTTIYAGFEEITRGMTEAERRALFHDNAVRIYRMR